MPPSHDPFRLLAPPPPSSPRRRLSTVPPPPSHVAASQQWQNSLQGTIWSDGKMAHRQQWKNGTQGTMWSNIICEWEEATQQPATPNLAGKEPNEWESTFIVNLTLASKHLFG